MDFNFIIDDTYILLKMINNRNKYEDLIIWKETVVSKILDKKVIEKIEQEIGTIEEYHFCGDFDKLIKEEDLEDKINILMEDLTFKKYFEEALTYFNSVKSAWLNNKDKINVFLKDKIKIKYFGDPIDVMISHPKLNTGKCVEQKCIFWGHYKGITDINYNITYLVHEYLHAILPNKNCMPEFMGMLYGKEDSITFIEKWQMLCRTIDNYENIYQFESDVIHTIIELISDNELYTLLSGESKYTEGHKSDDYSLVRFKELILPFWFNYLNMTDDEILARVPNFKSSKVDDLTDENKTNIETLIMFLINNKTIRNEFNIIDTNNKTITL